MSKIALVITDKETNAQIKNLGVGLLELRADLCKSQEPAYILEQIKKRRALKIPLLLTVRNQKSEGAVKTLSDAKKLAIIEAALPFIDMIDIELSSPLCRVIPAKAGIQKVKVIVSSHNFKRMPKNLEGILKKSLQAGADIVKVAGWARTPADVAAMTNFTHRHRRHKLITMCLGPVGSISRVLLPAAGSLYAYTFLHKPTAPGQIDIATLKSHMKLYLVS
jgi:3-dehydroquinate dehydratase-1